MHWRSDILTPRGPSLNIRPRPEQCKKWLLEAGFSEVTQVKLEASCPYHYGLVATRLEQRSERAQGLGDEKADADNYFTSSHLRTVK